MSFADQDIAIEFILSVLSGPAPLLYAGFCTEASLSECKKTALSYDPLNKKTSYLNDRFKLANLMGKDVNLVIDHDEKQCRDEYQGQCYYVVVVKGQGTVGDICKYSINIMDNQ